MCCFQGIKECLKSQSMKYRKGRQRIIIYRETGSINLTEMYLMHEIIVGVRRKMAMQ